MTSYPVQPRDRIFVKGYRFLYFAKNSREWNSKNSQKILDHAKQSATDELKMVFKKETDDLIDNKMIIKLPINYKTLKNVATEYFRIYYNLIYLYKFLEKKDSKLLRN